MSDPASKVELVPANEADELLLQLCNLGLLNQSNSRDTSCAAAQVFVDAKRYLRDRGLV